jgi:hypothetical protein
VTINRLLSSAILLIALLMAAMGGYTVLAKLTAMRELSEADSRLGVIRGLGNIQRFLIPASTAVPNVGHSSTFEKK